MFDYFKYCVSSVGIFLAPYVCPVCETYSSEPVCRSCTHSLISAFDGSRHISLQGVKEDPLFTNSHANVMTGASEGILSIRQPQDDIVAEKWMFDALDAGLRLVPIYSLFWLNDEMKAVVHAFKYSGRGELITWCLNSIDGECKDDLRHILENSDVVCCVPSSVSKSRNRIFDPPTQIAKKLAFRYRRPIANDTLLKIRDSVEQKALHRQERYSNLKGVFCLRSPELVKDKKVLIVDDVCTTGNTLARCAEAICEGQPKSVTAFTIALTPLDLERTKRFESIPGVEPQGEK